MEDKDGIAKNDIKLLATYMYGNLYYLEIYEENMKSLASKYPLTEDNNYVNSIAIAMEHDRKY